MAMSSVSRALARIASSSSQPTNAKRSPSLFLLLLKQQQQSSSSTYSTTTTTSSWSPFIKGKRKPSTPKTTSPGTRQKKTPSSTDWPRPLEIPFQGKVANSINLVGHVNTPVQFQLSSSDGKYWASTVITQDASLNSPAVRVPITFEGDLAHIAASHLKVGDHILITGQLSADPPPFPIMKDQGPIQVIVQNINFVEGIPKESQSLKQEEVPLKDSEDDESADQSWLQLLVNPNEWWDIRSDMENPKGAAFERKNDGELLWIDDTTPKWIQHKIEVMTFDQKTIVQEKKSQAFVTSASIKKDYSSTLKLWEDLLLNPKLWWDYRRSKINGSVSEKHPDFKRKDGSDPLWLDRVPAYVLSKLEGMEFDVMANIVKQEKQPHQASKVKGEESWKDLVENPSKWWDNRLDKRNVKAPDFKNKETGEALWLNSSPPWVLEKLPPLRSTQQLSSGKQDTLLS